MSDWKREKEAIAGRFLLQYRSADMIVVGCLGSLQARELTENQISFIRAFYHAEGEARIADIFVSTKARYALTNFNGFLIFEKKNRKDD